MHSLGPEEKRLCSPIIFYFKGQVTVYLAITRDPEWPSGLEPARHAGGPGSIPGRSVYQRLISRIFTAGGSVAL